MNQWIHVAFIADIPVDHLTTLRVNHQDLLIYRIQDEFYVYPDGCTHEAAPLSDGYLVNGTLICRLHGAKYDLQTGTCLKAPGLRDLYAYRTKVDGDVLYIDYTELQTVLPPTLTIHSCKSAPRPLLRRMRGS